MDYLPIKPKPGWQMPEEPPLLSESIGKSLTPIVKPLDNAVDWATSQVPHKQTSPGLILFIIGGMLCGLLLIVAVFGLLARSVIKPSPVVVTQPIVPTKDWESTSVKIEAFVMSQEFVKRRLNSPGSAEFPWFTDSEVSVLHYGSGTYHVTAYVDSQNSFGAKLRTHYTCQLKDEGKESWKLISLNTTP